MREINFNLKSVIVKNNHFNLSIIKILIKLFIALPKKVVEKSNKENLKVTENTLPSKSWNPEYLKKKFRAVGKLFD